MDSRNFPRLSKRSYRPDNFVADGHRRAREGNRRRIETEVRAEFADSMKGADAESLHQLKKAIRAEVEQRLTAIAPSDALY